MASKDQSGILLKLLIDNNSKRLLFAEAGKDFVDFLLSILSLPVGKVIKFLSANNMVGGLGKLYQSFESLSDIYLQPNVDKAMLLEPSCLVGPCYNTLLLLTDSDETIDSKKLFTCRNCGLSGSDERPGSKCQANYCAGIISKEVVYVPPPDPLSDPSASSGGGFVKGVITYMIMDDLEVKPMSTISSIAMLNKFNVTEIGALEEKTILVGMNEGLELLKASLETKSILTNVFLKMEDAPVTPL